MLQPFAIEFLGKAIRDYRAIAGVAGLGIAAISAMTGTSILMPWWGWLLVASAAFLLMTIKTEWLAYVDRHSSIDPDMKLVDVVKRIVGSDAILVGDNCSKTGDALMTLREFAHLDRIIIWGRRDALAGNIPNYPLTKIPAQYWDEFGIDYLHFISDMDGETKRVRGTIKREVVPNITMHTQHIVETPDTIYSDLRFSANQIGHHWPKKVSSFWPIKSAA